jgi:ATP-binding protein involved in chromosome partitioning
MTTEQLTKILMETLGAVPSSAPGQDVVSRGQVQNLVVEDGGAVRFSFFLAPDDAGSLVKDVRSAAEGIEGVSSVKVNVQLPQAAHGSSGGGGPQPGSVPAPTPKPGLLPGVGRIIAVSSGKGGVGKSMVAVNLATALARQGKRVGLLDADIYGPNIPLMFGETRRPPVTGEAGSEMIAPLEAHGVRLMSLGFMIDKEQPAIMRGPLISGILRQFLEQVAWGALDYMVVDMPPGTGDAQISLVQTIDIDGAVMVTTPQEVATGDVRRGIRMFEKVNTRVLGIVENMSGFHCPHCGETVDVFGKGGGEALAQELQLPFLGRIPLDPDVRVAGDVGVPTVARSPESPAGEALKGVAQAVEEVLTEGEGA